MFLGIMGGRKELECTSSPSHDVFQELFGLSPINQRLSSGDDPLFPCRICLSQLPPSFPIALCSLPLRQCTLSLAQHWPHCWEACLPKERWTPVGKHLGAISSTCYLESGSWSRVGRNKADSVLSLINDCWDQGAGAGLARAIAASHLGRNARPGLWGFCCAGLRRAQLLAAVSQCFSPSHPLLWVGWCGTESCSREQEGWWCCLWRGLVQSWHPSGGVFLPLVACLLLGHQLKAVLELRGPICG